MSLIKLPVAVAASDSVIIPPSQKSLTFSTVCLKNLSSVGGGGEINFPECPFRRVYPDSNGLEKLLVVHRGGGVLT